VDVDHVLSATAIGEMLERLSQRAEEGETDMAGASDPEPQLPSQETQVSEMEELYGGASSLTCPDCGGALWEVQDGRIIRYQCHVGHQYSPESLDAGPRDAVESALWSAVRVLEEHVELKSRMARRAAGNGMSVMADSFSQSAGEAHKQAQSIRALLFGRAGARPAGADDALAENGKPAAPKTRAARGRNKTPRRTAAAARRPAARKAARPKGRKR
jgi:two-component system chemotaxis response regulator CheB